MYPEPSENVAQDLRKVQSLCPFVCKNSKKSILWSCERMSLFLGNAYTYAERESARANGASGLKVFGNYLYHATFL